MTGKLYSQIEHEKLSGQDISVNGVLKKLGLSKSGYYDFVGRKPSETAKKVGHHLHRIFSFADKARMAQQIYDSQYGSCPQAYI